MWWQLLTDDEWWYQVIDEAYSDCDDRWRQDDLGTDTTAEVGPLAFADIPANGHH